MCFFIGINFYFKQTGYTGLKFADYILKRFKIKIFIFVF